jgi:hypothetical protein
MWQRGVHESPTTASSASSKSNRVSPSCDWLHRWLDCWRGGRNCGTSPIRIGHTSTALTQPIYTHVFDKVRVAAMRRLDGAIPCRESVARLTETTPEQPEQQGA